MALVTIKAFAIKRRLDPETVREKIKIGTIPADCLVVPRGSVKALLDEDKVDAVLKRKESPHRKLATSLQSHVGKAKKAALAKSNEDPNTKEIKGESRGPVHSSKDQNPSTSSPHPTTTHNPDPEKEAPEVQRIAMGESGDSFDRYQKAKADNEEMRNRKLALEIAEAENQLVNIEVVRKQIFKLVGETKEALLNLPAKVGPDLLACKDLVSLESRLHIEIVRALESLSRTMEK